MGGEREGERRHGRSGVYLKVYRHYADLIDSGQLRPGDQLPTYPELEKLWSISHATATKVIRLLRDDLYVISSTRGVFVHLDKHRRLFQQLTDILNQLEADDQQVQFEDGGNGSCIMGRNGGSCWDPGTRAWVTITF